MSREIRRVPANWKHPKGADWGKNDYKPLMGDYLGSLQYWIEENEKFVKHMTELIETGKTKVYEDTFTDRQKLYDYFTEDDQLQVPDIEDFMPQGPWYQLFETVSEGTPLSPPFSTPEELIEHLVKHGDSWRNIPWSRENAEAMLKQGFVMSGIISNGKFYQNEKAFEIKKDKNNG